MMTHLLAQDAVFLMSWFKPVLFVLVLVGWAWVVSHLDKDAAYYYLNRLWLNTAQMGAGVVGFGLMLWVPWFALGLIMGLIVLAGGILGYAYYRNTQVPPEARWTFSLDSFTRKIDQLQQARAQGQASVTLLGPKDAPLDVPVGDHPDVAAHQALESLLSFALPRQAQRIDLTVSGKEAALAVSIDGVRYAQPAPEPPVALRLVDYLKAAASLDVSDRRKRQSGSLGIDAHELGRHRLEVETAGSTRGLSLRIVINPGQRLRIPFDQLGLLEAQRQQVLEQINSHGRVVVAVAPPGHGVTTTLYSLLRQHDPYTSSIVSIQEEPEFEIDAVSQQIWPEGISAQEANEKLGVILRSDPNVVMLSRLADVQMARTIARSAEEVRFYLTWPQEDTFSALRTWLKLVGDPRRAADALGMIIAQRLVRKLCTTCRAPYKPDPAVLKKLNLPPDRVTQLYQASGKVIVGNKERPCPACAGLAYRGRVGVFEVMSLDDQARAHIAAGNLDALRSYLRKQRMLWLQEAALAKAVEGVTDIKEITRILSDKGAAAQQAPQPVAGA